ETATDAYLQPLLDIDFTFQVEDARAFEFDPLTQEPADNLPAAARGLKSKKVRFRQPPGPVRTQHAMGGDGDRIFRDAFGRCEITTDEVVPAIAYGRDNQAGTVQFCNRRHVGHKLPHGLWAFQHRNVVEDIGEDLDRDYP